MEKLKIKALEKSRLWQAQSQPPGAQTQYGRQGFPHKHQNPEVSTDHKGTLALRHYSVHQTILSLQYQEKLKGISLSVSFPKLPASLGPTQHLAHRVVQALLPRSFYRSSQECYQSSGLRWLPFTSGNCMMHFST